MIYYSTKSLEKSRFDCVFPGVLAILSAKDQGVDIFFRGMALSKKKSTGQLAG
ncbi:MAG: hypothetical protein KJ741_18050 [Proteobacteria bacterium]|nr:hypothetical protein [Pseudomonadota bacterium]